MQEQEPIVNKVAQSGLITLDLGEYFKDVRKAAFDIKGYLFEGIILKEKDFRAAMKQHDWQQYEGRYVAVDCSSDAIIPTWAYMLIAAYLQPFAAGMVHGDDQALDTFIAREVLSKVDVTRYKEERIIIKGCGEDVPQAAYAEIVRLLKPVAKSIMYGEPCSTVPIFKK